MTETVAEIILRDKLFLYQHVENVLFMEAD